MRARYKFRVDGGNNIGLGHVMRCMVVAELLREDGHECLFYLHRPPASVSALIDREGYTVVELASDDDFLSHLHKEDSVILDGYHFTSQYEREIKRFVRRLITIDDLANRRFYSDVIINHTPGVDKARYSTEPYTKIYTGLGYSLLRKEIITASRRKSAPAGLNRCFLCLGGEDPKNYLMKTLEDLLAKRPSLVVAVVVGASYPHGRLLQEFVNSQRNVTVHMNLGASGLIQAISEADFAVVSASTISLECAYLAIPLYLVVTADNQMGNYKYLVDQGLASPFSEYTAYKQETGTNMMGMQHAAFNQDIRANLKTIFAAQ